MQSNFCACETKLNCFRVRIHYFNTEVSARRNKGKERKQRKKTLNNEFSRNSNLFHHPSSFLSHTARNFHSATVQSLTARHFHRQISAVNVCGRNLNALFELMLMIKCKMISHDFCDQKVSKLFPCISKATLCVATNYFTNSIRSTVSCNKGI